MLHLIIYKTELSQITLWIFKCHRKIVSLIGNSVRNINFINWKKRKNCRQNRFSRTRLAGHLFQSKGARRWNREGWLTSAKSHATLSGCGPTGPQSFPRPPLQALSSLPLLPHPLPSSPPHIQRQLAGRDGSCSPCPRDSGATDRLSSLSILSMFCIHSLGF